MGEDVAAAAHRDARSGRQRDVYLCSRCVHGADDCRVWLDSLPVLLRADRADDRRYGPRARGRLSGRSIRLPAHRLAWNRGLCRRTGIAGPCRWFTVAVVATLTPRSDPPALSLAAGVPRG